MSVATFTPSSLNLATADKRPPAVTAEAEMADLLFQLCACLAPATPIPAPLLQAAFTQLEIKTGLLPPVLAWLYRWQMLTPTRKGPQITADMANWAATLPVPPYLISAMADGLIRCFCELNPVGQRYQLMLLQPHLTAVIHTAKRLKLPQLGILWGHLGNCYYQLAEFGAAQTAYESAVAVLELQHGALHPEVAATINNLSGVLMALGDWDGAKRALTRAMSIDAVNFGENHPEVGVALNNLGGLLVSMGDIEGARTVFERACRIFGQSLPCDHPYVQWTRENLEVLNHPPAPKRPQLPLLGLSGGLRWLILPQRANQMSQTFGVRQARPSRWAS